MQTPGPRQEHTRRMHRVLQHIEQHLHETLEVADLAEVAHFSPFHFHRLFTAWMGETLGDCLRRRRLEVAALRLLTQPRSSVLDIALAVGFGSGEAFARAFKGRFGCSPSQWRRQQQADRQAQMRKLDQGLRNLSQGISEGSGDDSVVPQPSTELLMNVTVKTLEPVRVAYLRHVGPYGAAVAAFWQQKFYPFLAQHQLLGRPIYGVSYDDPLITAPDKCRYDTCVAIADDFVVPSGALTATIAGGKYALLPFKGTSDTIGAAWTRMLRDWLPDSGYQLDGRPCFEFYPPGANYDQATGTFECEIVIPLKPLHA